ncbi:MAG: hypothetical protein ABII07_02010 [Patescibacteria group bacterium]|nr:hypothetical protein [Patescibacteria group bacterium]
MSESCESGGDDTDYIYYWIQLIEDFLSSTVFDSEDVRSRVGQCVRSIESIYGFKYVYTDCRFEKGRFAPISLRIVIDFEVGSVELVLDLETGEWLDSGYYIDAS